MVRYFLPFIRQSLNAPNFSRYFIRKCLMELNIMSRASGKEINNKF